MVLSRISAYHTPHITPGEQQVNGSSPGSKPGSDGLPQTPWTSSVPPGRLTGRAMQVALVRAQRCNDQQLETERRGAKHDQRRHRDRPGECRFMQR